MKINLEKAERSEVKSLYDCFKSAKPPRIPSEYLCSSRDVFQARLDSLTRQLVKISNPSTAGLISATLGEIGNNSFDHNLGKWPDLSGCVLRWGRNHSVVWFVLFDRGVGILSTLKQVKPNLHNDFEALDIAFTQTITSRAPERRGNGLKLVRQLITSNFGRGLFFQSGQAELVLGEAGSIARDLILPNSKKTKNHGTFALILWHLQTNQ